MAVVGSRSGKGTVLADLSVSLAAGPGVTQWFHIDTTMFSVNSSIVTAVATDNSGADVSRNVLPFTTPQVWSARRLWFW